MFFIPLRMFAERFPLQYEMENSVDIMQISGSRHKSWVSFNFAKNRGGL
jgi:hypothetical protein